MTVRMLQRRGTASQWNSVGGTVVLQPGEIGVNTTNNSFKIGDGESVWTDLEYYYSDNLNELKYLQLAGGNAVTGNQTITGNVDVTGLLSVSIDLDVDGDVSFGGDLTVTGSITSGQVNVNNNRITGVADPTSNTDAANKIYVDNAIAGLAWKEAVHLIAHGTGNNVALTGNTNTLIIDGHPALVQADSGIYRILLTAQTTSTENGIYLYTDNGTTYTLTRTTDADSPEELKGSSVYVQEGSTYGTSSWVQSNYNIDSFDDQVWSQFSGAALINDGAGLLKEGNTLSVIGTADRITVTPDNVDIASNYVGQTSITTLGTVTSGQWNAEKISIEKGGTGATTAAGALENLGLTATAAEINTLDGIAAPLGLEFRLSNDESAIFNLFSALEGKASLSSGNSFVGNQTVSGFINASNYNLAVSVEPSDTITLNFVAGTGMHTRSAAGNISISASNYTAGCTKTLFITCDSTSRTLTFPSSWIWVGPKPTSILASKTGVLTVTSLGTAEANAVASWVVQI